MFVINERPNDPVKAPVPGVNTEQAELERKQSVALENVLPEVREKKVVLWQGFGIKITRRQTSQSA